MHKFQKRNKDYVLVHEYNIAKSYLLSYKEYILTNLGFYIESLIHNLALGHF